MNTHGKVCPFPFQCRKLLTFQNVVFCSTRSTFSKSSDYFAKVNIALEKHKLLRNVGTNFDLLKCVNFPLLCNSNCNDVI